MARKRKEPPITQAAGSAATYTPVPPTVDDYGLAAKRAERERAFDDQSDTAFGGGSA